MQLNLRIKIDTILASNTTKDKKPRERLHKRIYTGSDPTILHPFLVIIQP